MGQALYRKYRSRKLDEIVGQDPVVKALSNALKTGKISHAYLFAGPRGVGKTSIARILAHNINDIEYTSDQMPIDIIEIDAASNRRIDEIRDLREKVVIAPVSAKYKVYIIDEVHMLTREAFNALLKTLEEPPAHVIFILATTEPHKLPETIVSRTQKYNFKLASTPEVAKLLKGISNKEQISISDDAIELIAEHSGGSLRDAVSLLDQVRHSEDEVSADLVSQNLGLPPKKLVSEVLSAIPSGDPKAMLSTLKKAYQSGANATLLANQIIEAIRNQISTGKLNFSEESALILMQDLLDMASTNNPEARLEIALINCQLSESSHPKQAKTVLAVVDNEPPLTVSAPLQHPLSKTKDPLVSNLDNELWQKVLGQIKKSHTTLHSILKTAQVEINDDKKTLKLRFYHPFHFKRMQDSKNKQVVTDTLMGMGVRDYTIEYEMMKTKPAVDVVEDSAIKTNSALNQISDIFGGAEVVE